MLLQTVNREILIARGVLAPAAGSGEQAAPGSAATITIYDSTVNSNGLQFSTPLPFSRLVLTILSSNDSGAQGVVVNGSDDNGLHWDLVQIGQSYLAANGLTTFDILVVTPQVQIKYTNSANVLTSWRMSLTGVLGDRAH